MKKSGIYIVLIIVVIITIVAYVMMKKNSLPPATDMPPAGADAGMSGPTTPPGTKPATTAPAPSPTTAAPAPITGTATVEIRDSAFSPAYLTVKKGTKVTWENYDQMSHTVTSDSGKLLDSGSLAEGSTYSLTLSTAGIYTYHCALHPNMKATIVVVN
ncbi:MAG: cupredoxin domain-containing protein [bacterium]